MTLWGQFEDWLKPLVRALRGPSAKTKRPARPKPAPDAPALTLFDLAPRPAPPARTPPEHRRPRVKPPASAAAPHAPAPIVPAAGAASSAQDRYDQVTRAMLQKYGIRVRRWRTSMSGVAWEVRYTNGSTARLIEAPRPKGPMSAAIFLHEIGHHAIGFNTYKPRCLEEYHAWAWSIRAMQEHGLAVTDAVKHRMADSLWYAVAKARRRGIKALPEELMAYTTRPPRRRRRRPA